MIVPVAKLQGSSLDWSVGLAEFGEAFYKIPDWWFDDRPDGCFLPPFKETGESPTVDSFYPSSDMNYGGAIFERARIAVSPILDRGGWSASLGDLTFEGRTLLMAAMRCYVASKLGPEIDVPNRLLPPELLDQYRIR